MFISVDLKVIEGLADATARAAGVDFDRILAGLVRLWHRVWVDQIDHLGLRELAGVFGGKDLPQIIEALTDHEFLEASDQGVNLWRVRGAKRYLRLKESRRRGAAITNAKRWGKAPETNGSHPPASGSYPVAPPDIADALERPASDAVERPGAFAQRRSGTDHRSPITEKASQLAKSDFVAFVTNARVEAGHPSEKAIPDLDTRLAPVIAELAGDWDRLKLGYLEYLQETRYWALQKPPHPLRGFLSQALDFVPKKRAPATPPPDEEPIDPALQAAIDASPSPWDQR